MNKIRTCIACRKKGQKADFFRLVHINNKLTLDANQGINSRGIYLCKDKNCISRFKNIKVIPSVIKFKISKEDIINCMNELEEKLI